MKIYKPIRDAKITDIKISDDNISAYINGFLYVGTVWECNGVKCINYLRNINCNKQTTVRIKSQIENLINNN